MLAIALDSSQISQYLYCPYSWNLRYRQNLAKVSEEREALVKGTRFHEYLEYYYNLAINCPMLDYSTRAKEVVEKFLKPPEIPAPFIWDEEREKFIAQRFLQYALRYSQDDFTPLKSQGAAAVEVGFSKQIYQDQDFTFIIEGRLDLIGELAGKILWIDHKTQDRMRNLYQYKTQFLTYGLASELEYGLINYIGLTKEANNNTFRRQLIHFPKWKLVEWQEFIIKDVFFPIAHKLKEYQYIRERIKDSQILAYVERQEETKFEKHLNSCAGAFDSNPCMYVNICETNTPEMVRNIKAFNYAKGEPWSPWE